jgi:hypothetical protein
VPNDKIHYVTFHAATCNSWWQARFVEAHLELNADLEYVNSHIEPGDMWEIRNAAGSGRGVGLIHQWQCDSNTSRQAFGSYGYNTKTVDDVGTSRGTLKQYKAGVLKIYSTLIQADPLWAAADDARRRRLARNVIRHEMWHQFGLGHENTGLMGAGDFWNNEYWPTASQYRRVECYNPDNGGLFDDCL